MANTTVGIRERIKTPEGRWCWTQNLRTPEDDLKPPEAERKGKFYLFWTAGGEKREQRVKGIVHIGREFPAVVDAGCRESGLERNS